MNEFDNPQVAGFGTATAEDPPFPAQQHLDATDGSKVGVPIVTQEVGGQPQVVQGDGTREDAGGDVVDPEDAVADADYHAKGVTVKHLQDEIDHRNEDRAEEEKIPREGKKADLIAALQADDEAQG